MIVYYRGEGSELLQRQCRQYEVCIECRERLLDHKPTRWALTCDYCKEVIHLDCYPMFEQMHMVNKRILFMCLECREGND